MINKTSEELITEFPFLKATDENPWCYGNCEGDNWFYECPEGWQNMFYDLLYAIKPILEICGGTLQIRQVKEKFGGLRFYYELSNCDDKATQEIRNLVNYAEDLSYKICLHCGKPVKYRTTGWITYICEECANKIGKDKCLLVNNESND